MRRFVLGVFACALALVLVPSAGAAFSGVTAKEWTAKIAGLGQRLAGSAKEQRAGQIVWAQLAELGYTVRSQPFRLPNGDWSRNVVGRTDGPVRVIIVAHIDGVHGTQAANDNASGVGSVLELARNLSGKEGVLVAALGAEERMVTGSRYHLGSLRLTRSLSPTTKAGVRLALSVDMVGVGTTLNVRGLEASPNRSARRLLARARALGIKATYLRDTGQSDHDDLTRGGVPAAWIEWRWDDCWHRPCDRIARVKPWKLQPAGRIVLAAARSVVG
jgi:hypothetical protein